MGGEHVRENRRKAKEERKLGDTAADPKKKRQMKDRRKELKAERKEERRAEKKTRKALKKKAKKEEEEEAGKTESECDSEDQRHVEAEELPSAREPAELHAPMPPDHAPRQVPAYYYREADGAQRSYQTPAPAPAPAYIVSPLSRQPDEDLKTMAATAWPRAEAPWRLDRPYVAGTTTTTYYELA
ncbi:hypothetical protein F4809DRAFT_600866 [Biscogniauxia mediterranea]|nr:hypothetical protein F4809DRAFT_600866 [Biscogniauxia mediterranea]